MNKTATELEWRKRLEAYRDRRDPRDWKPQQIANLSWLWSHELESGVTSISIDTQPRKSIIRSPGIFWFDVTGTVASIDTVVYIGDESA